MTMIAVMRAPARTQLLLAALHCATAAGPTATAFIDTSAVLSRTAADYLSFNIDAAELAAGKRAPFPWSSPSLAKLTAHLAPAKLRVGGGAQSHTKYDAATLKQIGEIAAFKAAANVSLVWGTAPCGAKRHGACDMANAKALLDSEPGAAIDEWEYGNEPGPQGDAAELARNFLAFSKLLQAAHPGKPLVGADVGYGAWADPPLPGTADEAWLQTFYAAAGGVLGGATVHIYPFDHNDVGGDAHAVENQPPNPWYVHKAQYLGRNYCSTGTAQGTAVATPSGACAIYKNEKSTCLGDDGKSILYEWGCEALLDSKCHTCKFNKTIPAGSQCTADARGTPYTWSCVREADTHRNVRCEAFPSADCSGKPSSLTYDFGNENSGFCIACNRSGSEKLVLNQCSKLVCLNCRPRDPTTTYDLLTCEKKGSAGSQYCTCGPPLPHASGVDSTLQDPACASEGGRPSMPWCNYSRVIWPGPGELFDTRPVQDFAINFARIVRQNSTGGAAATSLRIGETAAVNHGGWANVTNAFVSGFWSVYQIGWLAQAGYQVMHRQSLACRGGDSGMGHSERCAYGLLTNPTAAGVFAPTPDYWTTLLHKRLMGRDILNCSASKAAPMDWVRDGLVPKEQVGKIRLFAACAETGGAGAVTLMYANPQAVAVALALPAADNLGGSARELFVLSANGMHNPPLQSSQILLNGVTLSMVGADKTELPPLAGKAQAAVNPLLLPPRTYGFVVLAEAKAAACMKKHRHALKVDDDEPGAGASNAVRWFVTPRVLTNASLAFATSGLSDGVLLCCHLAKVDGTGRLNLSSWFKPGGQNFSALRAAGKVVTLDIGGDQTACASESSCAMWDGRAQLAIDVLAFAKRYDFHAITLDWEFGHSFGWKKWNATWAYVAEELRADGITFEVCINSGVESEIWAAGGDPSGNPYFRQYPWANRLTGMGTYSLCCGRGAGIICTESQRQYNLTQNLEPYVPKGRTKGWAGVLEGRATNLFKMGKVRKELSPAPASGSRTTARPRAAPTTRRPRTAGRPRRCARSCRTNTGRACGRSTSGVASVGSCRCPARRARGCSRSWSGGSSCNKPSR